MRCYNTIFEAFFVTKKTTTIGYVKNTRELRYLYWPKKVCVHAFGCFFRYFILIFYKHVVYALKVRPILNSMNGESCTSDWCDGNGLFLNDLKGKNIVMTI